MTPATLRERLEHGIGGVVLAALIPVVAVAIIGSNTQVVPAIVIAALIAVAEVIRDRDRQRIDALEAAAAVRADVPPVNRAAPAAVAEPPVDRAAVVRSGPPIALLEYLATDRRRDDVQCPTCGRFLVDVAHGDAETFSCRACGATWTTGLDDPWPDVHIVPDLESLRRGPASTSQ